jgi:signal transduction histidine kinase/ActR/RegA family two-component response regulator
VSPSSSVVHVLPPASPDADELAVQRRHVRLLEGLTSAMQDGETVEHLLSRLLQLFVDDLRASVAVARLKDGQILRSRAAVGLSAEVENGFSIALQQAFGARPLSELTCEIVPAEEPNPLGSPGSIEGVVSVLRVPLLTEDALMGAFWLGLPYDYELGAAERRIWSSLAPRVAAAISDRVVREGLERGVRSRDEILGIVAHDLRNPLNVISAAASSLHHRTTDAVSRRPLERIMRAAQRAEHLIRDLLDLSAIEGGHFSIEKRSIDTANVILSALDSQQGLAATSCVILASDLSPALPWVEADEERVLEVLENLVGNAVKFTMAGGTVTVGAGVRNDTLTLWVKDNGPGIAADQLTHLFDRFWQASKTDRRGTGLGLTICKAIVEAHGGRIWAESELGQGTTVFFTLPGHMRSPKSGGPPIANILMVDDRPENLLSLRAILEQPDYHLVSASSGEEALSLTLRESFAVALIDISMPGMDGLEVAIHMKELERSRDIPIIFITAFGDDPEEIHRAYSAGGADYLVKPLDAEIVRKKVAVFVDLSRRRDDRERQKNAEAGN